MRAYGATSKLRWAAREGDCFDYDERHHRLATATWTDHGSERSVSLRVISMSA